MSARRAVFQISARAFVSPRCAGGGNPVTIFVPSSSNNGSSATLSPEFRSRLAQTCAWESVVVEPYEEDTSSTLVVLPQFSFFMPSGEEVSFCAHAAIAACSFLANKTSIIMSANASSTKEQRSKDNNHDDDDDEEEEEEEQQQQHKEITFITAHDRSKKYNAIVRGSEAELIMNCEHHESECDTNGITLCDFLKQIGLNEDDIDKRSDNNSATMSSTALLNSSVARPKTLIPVKSADLLHAATGPQNATKFQQMCESIDSTGLYLYDSSTMNNIECRQFPKSSGYAEDPATGIAAGALAASLFRRRQHLNSNDEASTTTICQGTAMGRPSQIKVKIENYTTLSSSTTTNYTNQSHIGNVKISYAGLVTFDSVSYMDDPEFSVGV